jgi:hypothetical protein
LAKIDLFPIIYSHIEKQPSVYVKKYRKPCLSGIILAMHYYSKTSWKQHKVIAFVPGHREALTSDESVDAVATAAL